jgi:hypothetical protein
MAGEQTQLAAHVPPVETSVAGGAGERELDQGWSKERKLIFACKIVGKSSVVVHAAARGFLAPAAPANQNHARM